MAIRVTNVAYPAQFITLPAPYQGILRSGASEVIDTTREAFLTKMGESDTCLGALTIETVTDAPTIIEDTDLGGGGGVSVEMSASTGTSGAPFTWPAGKTVFGSTAGAPRYIELPAPAAADAASQYVVKDAANNAATHNITVTASGGANIDSGTSADISSNGGSLSFVTDGTKWLII